MLYISKKETLKLYKQIPIMKRVSINVYGLVDDRIFIKLDHYINKSERKEAFKLLSLPSMYIGWTEYSRESKIKPATQE